MIHKTSVDQTQTEREATHTQTHRDTHTTRETQTLRHNHAPEEFEVKLSKKKKVTFYKIKVDKKSIDETIDNLQVQHGGHMHPETSESTDVLSGLLTQEESELKNNTAIEIGQLEKKVQKTFVGKKVEDLIEFDLRKVFADDNQVAIQTGKTPEEAKELKGTVEFKIETISRPVSAELNQEFFDRIFGPGNIKDEEQFREKIEESISSNYGRETDTLLIRDIQDSLIKDVKASMPDQFLKKWLLETNEELTDEDIEKEYESYARELKWNLIKNKIAKDNEVKVEHEEVIETTKNMIRSQFGQAATSPQIEENLDSFADNYLKAEEGNNYMKVYNQVQADKIFDLIKEKITISEKNVNIEQFKKLALN